MANFVMCGGSAMPCPEYTEAEKAAYAYEQKHLEEKAEYRARCGVPASDRGRK